MKKDKIRAKQTDLSAHPRLMSGKIFDLRSELLGFGLCPSPDIPKTVSETLCSLVFRIPDDGQSPKTQ
jgi:hypothetical protein